MSSKLVELLTRDEGLRLKPYKDTVGKLTIGIGRNLDDKGISQAEAEYLLDNDIKEVQASLDQLLPWWRDLNEARQAVLVSMGFNLGVFGLLSFKTTLGLVQKGNFQEASVQMLKSLWAVQVGARAKRLSRQLATGEWQ